MDKCPTCKHDYEPKPEQTAGEKWVEELSNATMRKWYPGYSKSCSCSSCAEARKALAEIFDLGRASMQPTPEPPDETAFQKAAREFLRASGSSLSDDPWDRIERIYDARIPALCVLWNTRGKLDLNVTKGRGSTRHAARSIIDLDEPETK